MGMWIWSGSKIQRILRASFIVGPQRFCLRARSPNAMCAKEHQPLLKRRTSNCGWGLFRVFAYIKLPWGKRTETKEHAAAEKAADSNCDILFLGRGWPSNLVIVSSYSLALSPLLSLPLSSPSKMEEQTIVKLISV